jgi:class 3 adenylate cyclase
LEEHILREKLSLFVAVFFRRHLRDELKKKPELVNSITVEGIPFYQITKMHIEELETDIPELKTINEEVENIFLEWNFEFLKIEKTVKPYTESTYKMFNIRLLSRIRDLRKGSESSREELKKVFTEALPKLNFYGHKINFGQLFQGENLLKEIFRKYIFQQNDFPREQGYKLFNEQSVYITNIYYNFFDQTLQASLERSDTILKRTLPESIAEELKKTEKVKPIYIENASVCFTDFVGFTNLATKMNPEELVAELDFCFSFFDSVIQKYKLEKIKTIGDAYLFTGGILSNNVCQLHEVLQASFEILDFMNERKKLMEDSNKMYWDIRIGIHYGDLVAGVIGVKRFAFDIWGDTVNTASRMESNSLAGKINVSQIVYNKQKENFIFEERNSIEVKGKGKMKMYFASKK